jgi:dolichyl-phosphate beta-glucosyltransferase
MFREATRITAAVEEMATSALSVEGTEVLLVDDGSDDGTSAVAEQVVARTGLPARVLRHEVNRGKGAAVRTGMLAARGSAVVFADADLSAGVTDILRCFEAVESGRFDVVFATRASPESEIPVPQPALRQLSGKMFNRLLRALGLTDATDTQCGLKGFTAPAARTLFEALSIDRFAFDVELLWRARHEGMRVHELPIVWRHVEASRVSLSKDSTRMLLDVVRLRVRLRKESRGARRSHARAEV